MTWLRWLLETAVLIASNTASLLTELQALRQQAEQHTTLLTEIRDLLRKVK